MSAEQPVSGPSTDSTRKLHVACIMDGNGRWAAARGLPRVDGHTEGEENLARLVRIAVTREIGWLTVFGFSTENWVRPPTEVRHILGLHERLFGRVQELNELDVRIQWIGRPFDSPSARTPKYVQRAIRKAIADTARNTGMVLTVAFDYGGRAELMAAVRAARAAGRPVTPVTIDEHLYLPSLPPVDVMVRTSGERRVSNFLLWQAAGAKIDFTDVAWPEFGAADLDRAIALVR
ncbi:MAG: polyprenyl diphosphate synthase [Ilumatobacteraceae bacterium]